MKVANNWSLHLVVELRFQAARCNKPCLLTCSFRLSSFHNQPHLTIVFNQLDYWASTWLTITSARTLEKAIKFCQICITRIEHWNRLNQTHTSWIVLRWCLEDLCLKRQYNDFCCSSKDNASTFHSCLLVPSRLLPLDQPPATWVTPHPNKSLISLIGCQGRTWRIWPKEIEPY